MAKHDDENQDVVIDPQVLAAIVRLIDLNAKRLRIDPENVEALTVDEKRRVLSDNTLVAQVRALSKSTGRKLSRGPASLMICYALESMKWVPGVTVDSLSKASERQFSPGDFQTYLSELQVKGKIRILSGQIYMRGYDMNGQAWLNMKAADN